MLDEVVTGVLVNLISAAGRQMGAGLITLRSHRYKEDIELARWFDTYSLTANIPKLPVLPRTVTAEMLADASCSGTNFTLYLMNCSRRG